MNDLWKQSLRRALPFALVLVGGGAIAVVVRTRAVEVRALPVSVGTVIREASGSGTLESERVLNVAFTIPGRLAAVHFDEGEWVREGDALAVLEADQESNRVAIARQNVSLASAGIERATAETRSAEASLAAAAAERQRIEMLFESGATSAAALDAARERHARAEAALAAARAARRQGAGTLSVARAGLALDTSIRDETVIRSPFDGVVVRRMLDPGAVLAPGTVVLTVASTRKIWARTWLDETVLQALRHGQLARVALRGQPERSYRARVDRIGVEADRETHEVLVDLELVERPERIVFGQRVDGYVELERRDGVVRAPRGACDEATSVCSVLREGRVAVADVRFGLVGSEFVQVERGLTPRELLVLPNTDGSPLPVGRRARRVSP